MSITATVSLEVPALDEISRADDLELIEVMRKWAQARRAVDAGLATLAGVVAARSSLELGYDGLAQRAGARTADVFVSQLTGTSAPEARAITAVGTMMSDPAASLGEVANSVTAGDLSIGAAAAIEQLDWPDTANAEYVAVAQLQADAFITLDDELARAVEAIVTVAPYDALLQDESA